MRGLLIRFTVTGIAVFLAAQIVPGIRIDGAAAGIAACIVLAVLNALVRPILYLFTLPFIILSLGLFMVIINALLLQLAAYMVKGFVVEGFWDAILGAILISLVSTILTLWVSEEGRVEMVHRKAPRVIN